MPAAILRLFFLSLILFSVGCSDYDRRWREAQSAAPGADPFAGTYTGTWESSKYKGASGKLRCILTRQGPNSYRADFHATWHGVFTSRHTVELQVTSRSRKGGQPTAGFSGAAEIKMWIGSGHYHCAGTMTPAGLVAEYDAKYDIGKFQLDRVTARVVQGN